MPNHLRLSLIASSDRPALSPITISGAIALNSIPIRFGSFSSLTQFHFQCAHRSCAARYQCVYRHSGQIVVYLYHK